VSTIKNRKVLTAGAVAVLAIAGAATWWLGRPAPTSGSAAPQRLVYTVERRPFKAVVTLDAAVTTAPAVTVSRQQQGANVAWSVRTGDTVKAGQRVGREVAADARSGSGQSVAAADLTRAKRQLARLKETNALDIADAEAAVRAAAPADLATARRALARARLTVQQSVDDMEAQIAGLRSALAAAGSQPGKLTAPVGGTITVSADGSAATIEPTGYLVSAPVDPLVLYRLLDDSGRPISKQNEVVLTGLATKFPCTNLKLQDKASAGEASEQQSAASGAAQAAAATTAVSCHVPAGIKVFPGLKATLAITVADLPDALVLDAAGIRASSDNKALVSQLDPDGRVQSQTVEIGHTDGLSVVVLDGLNEGDRVVDPSTG
jgi:macrolide-specific efflux system membrane fusion protein